MKYNKINFRGHEGYFIDDRISLDEKKDGYCYYSLRHEDDGCDPCSIEDYVMINHWGTICFKESINHLLEPWATNRLSTNLTEEEVEDIYTAMSSGDMVDL